MALRIVQGEPAKLTVVDPEFQLILRPPTPAQLRVAQIGPQGVPGVQGPTGPTGPAGEAWLPEFYETSSPPVGPKQGDQWIVNNLMEGS